MEHALAEMPLALFSTLVPLGAGAFIMLAVAFMTGALSEHDSKLRRADMLTAIPLVLVVLGFIASFFHLASPGNAFNALNGIGRSPLSNELLAGIIFTVVAVVYWAVALSGKLGFAARKGLVAVVALLAVVFVVFIGAAYMVSTIPTWNTPLPAVGMLGFALLGGGLFGLLVLQSAGGLEEAAQGGFKNAAIAVSIIGCAAAIIGVAGQFALASGIAAAAMAAADVQPWLIAFCVGAVIAVILAILSVVRKPSSGLVSLGCLVALATVLVGRLLFYALYVNVGI